MFLKMMKTVKKSNKEISLLDLSEFVTRLFQFNKTLPILTQNVIEQVKILDDKNIKEIYNNCPQMVNYNIDAMTLKNIISHYTEFQYNYKYLGLSVLDRMTYMTNYIKHCHD